MPYIIFTTQTNYNSGGTKIYFFTCKEINGLTDILFEIHSENEILPKEECECYVYALLNFNKCDIYEDLEDIISKYSDISCGKKIKIIYRDKLDKIISENKIMCQKCNLRPKFIYDKKQSYQFSIEDKIHIHIDEENDLENVSWFSVNS